MDLVNSSKYVLQRSHNNLVIPSSVPACFTAVQSACPGGWEEKHIEPKGAAGDQIFTQIRVQGGGGLQYYWVRMCNSG